MAKKPGKRKKLTQKDVEAAAERLKNWGKWGKDDEIGTLNYTTPDDIVKAASLIRKGQVISLALNYDSTGPSDINDGGQAVGSAATLLRVGPPPKWKQTAWFSQSGVLIRLADQVVDWGPFDNGLSRAVGINGSGAIVGDLNWHAYLAIPTP